MDSTLYALRFAHRSTLVEEPQIVQLKGTVVNEPLLQVDKRIIAWTREGGGSKVRFGKNRSSVCTLIQPFLR